jgi:hypothetical protein
MGAPATVVQRSLGGSPNPAGIRTPAITLVAVVAVRLAALSMPAYARRMDDDATYICGECGEEIVVPIDLSAGAVQEYVEDCPVCCRANVIHVEIEPDGDLRVWSEVE